MPIRYIYHQVNDNLNNGENKKTGVRPQPISFENINSDKLSDLMVFLNGRGKGEAQKAISDVFEAIEYSLKRGDTVTIDRFATFQLTLRFVGSLVGSENQRAESIEVKGVSLRTSAQLRKRLTSAGFERTTSKQRSL